MPAVIGIDPSLTGTGLAWADGHTEVLDFAKGSLRHITGDHRLLAIANSVTAMIRDSLTFEVGPYAVIEDLPKNAQAAGLTGMAQGVVRMILVEHDVPYVPVVASTLKVFATGRGTCSKPDMRVELLRRADLDLANDNECDAWWLRELGLHKLGHPTIKLPQTHTRALAAVKDWR